MNMSFREVNHIVTGRLMDLIACHQIKSEGAKLDWEKVEAESDEDVFPRWR